MQGSKRPRPRSLGRSTAMAMAAAVVAVAAVALAFAGGSAGAPPAGRAVVASPSASVPDRASASASARVEPAVVAPTTRPGPSTSGDASALPLVPIVGFWSTVRSLSMDEVRDALRGEDGRFRQVLVADPDLPALAAGLKVRAGPAVRHWAPRR